MTMDYSPWVKREIWPFLKVAISLKPKKSHPPKLVCMYVTCFYICMNFLSQFQSIKFFDDHGLIVHGLKGNLAVFEGSNISKTEEVTPTKIGVRTFDMCLYLHEFFEPILIN